MKNEQEWLCGIGVKWESVGAMTGRIFPCGSVRAQLVLRNLEHFSNGERPDLHLRECSRTLGTVLVRIVHPFQLREYSLFRPRSFTRKRLRHCSRYSRDCVFRFEDESFF